MELDIYILVVNSVLDLIILYVLISLKHPRRISAKYDLICNFFLADFLTNVFGARFDPWYANLFALESKSYVFDKYLSLTCLVTAILTLTFLNLLSCNGCFQGNPAIAVAIIWTLSILFFTHSYMNKNRTFWNLLPLAVFSLVCVIGEYFKRAISFDYWRRPDNIKVLMPLVYIACNTVIVKSKYHMEKEQGNEFGIALFTSLNLGKNILLIFFMSRADPRIKEGLLQCLWKRIDPPLPGTASVVNNEENGYSNHPNRTEEFSNQDIKQNTNSISTGEKSLVHDLIQESNSRGPYKLYPYLPITHQNHQSRNLDYSTNVSHIGNNLCTSKQEQLIDNGNYHKETWGNNFGGEGNNCDITVDSSRSASNSGYLVRCNSGNNSKSGNNNQL